MSDQTRTYPKNRTGKAQAVQLEYLVNYMVSNPEFAAGRFAHMRGQDGLRSEWKELTETLNTMGPCRSEEKWKRMWNDLKSKTRKKKSDLRVAAAATGNFPVAGSLTELEKKILGVIGEESAVGNIIPEPNERAIADLIAGREITGSPEPLRIHVRAAAADDDLDDLGDESTDIINAALLDMTDADAGEIVTSQGAGPSSANSSTAPADIAAETSFGSGSGSGSGQTSGRKRRLASAVGRGGKQRRLSEQLNAVSVAAAEMAETQNNLLLGIKEALEKRNAIEEERNKILAERNKIEAEKNRLQEDFKTLQEAKLVAEENRNMLLERKLQLQFAAGTIIPK